MKKFSLFYVSISILIIGIILSGCGHQHIWKDATCSDPQTCTTCGETMGDILEHTWTEATCETPKTCSVCGLTEGEVSEHQWEEATCETPKTCSVCGLTEGDIIEHDFAEATFDSPKTCKVCGITEGGVYTLVDADDVNEIYGEFGDDAIILPNAFLMEDYDGYSNNGFGIFDYNQKGIGYYAYSTLGYGITCGYTSVSKDNVYIVYTDWSGHEDDSIYMIIGVHDFEGNFLDKKMIPVSSFKVGDIYACDIEGGQYIIFKYESKDSAEAAFDKTTQKFVDISEVPFDMERFKDYSRFSYSEAAGCYFVCTKEDNKWGYADKDGNLIKTYYEVSDFTSQGYALILDDDGNVSIIDKDFNVVKENIMTGEGVFVTGDTLIVRREGKKYFYRIGLSDSIDSNDQDSEQSQADATAMILNSRYL